MSESGSVLGRTPSRSTSTNEATTTPADVADPTYTTNSNNSEIVGAVGVSTLASSSYSGDGQQQSSAQVTGGGGAFTDDDGGEDYVDNEDVQPPLAATGRQSSSKHHNQPNSSKASSRKSSSNRINGGSGLASSSSSPPRLPLHHQQQHAPPAAVATRVAVHPVLGVPIPTATQSDDHGGTTSATTNDELRIDELLAQFYGGTKILPTRPTTTATLTNNKGLPNTTTAQQQQRSKSANINKDNVVDDNEDSASSDGLEALVMDGVFEAEMQLREQRHNARIERAFQPQQTNPNPSNNNNARTGSPVPTSRGGHPSPHHSHTSSISHQHHDKNDNAAATTASALQHPIGRIGDLTPREVLTVLMNMGERDGSGGGLLIDERNHYHNNMDDLLHPYISDADLAALDNYASMKEQSRIHEEERSRLRSQLNVAILGSSNNNDADGDDDDHTPQHQTIHSAKQNRLKDKAIQSLYKTVAVLREEAGHLQQEYAEYTSTVQGSLHDIAARNLELQLLKQRQDAKYDAYIHGQRRWIDRDIHEFNDEDLPAKLARIEGTFGSHHINFLEDIGATSAERFKAENIQLVRSTETNLLRLLHEDSVQRVQRMEGRLVRKLYSGLFSDVLSQFMAGNKNHGTDAQAGGGGGGGGGENEGGSGLLADTKEGVDDANSSMSPRRLNRKKEKNASLMNIPPIMRRVVDAECSDRLKRITSEVSTTVAPRARHTLEQRLRTSVQGGLQDLHRKLEVVLQSPSAHILTTFRRELKTSIEHAQSELEAIQAECESDRQQRQKVLLSALDVMCTNFDKIAAGTRIVSKGGENGDGDRSPAGGGGGLKWGSENDTTLTSMIHPNNTNNNNNNTNTSFYSNADDDHTTTTTTDPHTDAAMLAKLSSEVSARHRRLVQRRRAAREHMKAEHGPYVAPGNIGYRRKWMEDELGTDSEFEEDQRVIREEREARVSKDLLKEISELLLQFRTNVTMVESSEHLGREAVEDAEIASRNNVINAGLNGDYGDMDSGKPMISPFGNNTNRQTRVFVDKGNKRGKMASLRKAVYARSLRRRRVLQKRVAEARAAQMKRDAAAGRGEGGRRKRRALKFSSKGSTPQRSHHNQQQHRASSAAVSEAPATPATPTSGGAFRLQSPAIGTPTTPTLPQQQPTPHQQHSYNTNAERNAQINAIRAELEELKRNERERERRELARNRRVVEEDADGPYGYSRHELQALQELRRLRQTSTTNPTMTHRGLITAGGDFDYNNNNSGALPQYHSNNNNQQQPSSLSPYRSMSPGSAASYPYHNHNHNHNSSASPSRGGGGLRGAVPPSARQTSAIPKATPLFGDTPVPSNQQQQRRRPVRSSYYISNRSRHHNQNEYDAVQPPSAPIAAQPRKFTNRAEVGRPGLGAPSSTGSSRTTTPRGGGGTRGSAAGSGGNVNKALLNPNQGGLALRESAYKTLTNGGSRWK